MPKEQYAQTSGDQGLDCIGLAIKYLSTELKNKIVRLAKSPSESNWASVDQVIQGVEAKEEALQTVGELLLPQGEAQWDILAALSRVQEKVSDLQAEKSGLLLQAWASLDQHGMAEDALSLQIEALEAVGRELLVQKEWEFVAEDVEQVQVDVCGSSLQGGAWPFG